MNNLLNLLNTNRASQKIFNLFHEALEEFFPKMNIYQIEINPKELGERIRKLRFKRNKTQSYFADMLYISPSYLALIESGKRVPNLDLLIHIAKFTDVTLDYLVFGDDPNCDPLQMTFNRLNDSYENRQLERAMKLAEFYLEMTKDDDKIKDNINKK